MANTRKEIVQQIRVDASKKQKEAVVEEIIQKKIASKNYHELKKVPGLLRPKQPFLTAKEAKPIIENFVMETERYPMACQVAEDNGATKEDPEWVEILEWVLAAAAKGGCVEGFGRALIILGREYNLAELETLRDNISER